MDLPNTFVVPEDLAPDRADRILSECLPGDLTRSAIGRLIRQDRVVRQGKPVRPSTILRPGDRIELVQTAGPVEPTRPHDIPHFDILHEDSHLVIVDKPAGLVVHPGAGRTSGTLMDALVASRDSMRGVGEPGRWGIVHRLDRDTSGVMVLAKSLSAYESLSRQFREHSVHRIYMALVRGNPGRDEGIVDTPIGRHAKDRKKISTSTTKARQAVTRWTVHRRLGTIALLKVRPETGRTHQIRVHLASIGLPVLGDQVYGKLRKKAGASDPALRKVARLLGRQALHAAVLGFEHPGTSEYVEFSSELPDDMVEAISSLQPAES